MSCDNLPGNGEVAKQAFTSFARLLNPELAKWIEESVSFPNSMVDRITPVTTDADREFVAREFGVVDAWPVLCEPFVQWVLEDSFTLGRPPFEEVGVQMVSDVAPYELMKLRLLNGSHQAMAYSGYLLGHRLVHEAASDPLIVSLMKRYMDNEASPTLVPVPGIDVDAYKATLLERFANPFVRDTLARLATDASDRIPKFVLPVVWDDLLRDVPVVASAAVVASWAVFALTVDEPAAPDRRQAAVAAAIARQANDGVGFLRDPELFGDLAEREAFAVLFSETYAAILRDGVTSALVEILREE